jgi:D-arabinose 1-dehydrogenase-like Zn-dependent alcohol dehydrogenase
MQLEILGCSMGTASELGDLLTFCEERGVRPVVDSVYGFSQVADAFARLHSGEVFGKVVLKHAE